MELRAARKTLGLSQSHLSRLSGVSRFKICLFELGDGSLSIQEQDRIRGALQTETDRLRKLPESFEFSEPGQGNPCGTPSFKGEQSR
jgi:transcriptional regulator with XRE-family HTH domain